MESTLKELRESVVMDSVVQHYGDRLMAPSIDNNCFHLPNMQ